MKLVFYRTIETQVVLNNEEEALVLEYAAKHAISTVDAANDLFQLGVLNCYHRSRTVDDEIEVIIVEDYNGKI